ncbi:unnamed protein product [Discula destructiva]
MAPQDTFMDDEEETCPLCIEEFDLSDKNFRPCPCGYQVCQFCYHNIKTNMNGLCPACRRTYDEKTIQYKAVTVEEQAEFRANLQKSRKKRAEIQGQREVQKRESEKDARKNLVGIRVVQKNLVYVTGLTPTVREDELLRTLREKQFFGQYGNIQKISISNRKNQEGLNQSLGIYVTFEKKEDAQRCIQAVNGSQNGDRILKAQLGTTKYCSAWLRHEPCTNRNCMFLHELGEEEDSYTRQDLSSLNSMQANSRAGGSRSASRQQAQPQQQLQASQPMARTSSKDGSEIGDGPALPATASWARSTQQRSRRGSHATSGAASSPPVSMSLPATTETTEEAVESTQEEAPAEPVIHAPKSQNHHDVALQELLRVMGNCNFTLRPRSPPDTTIPPLFDPRGGEKRRAMREEEERRVNGEQDEQQVEPAEPSEEEPESGSHALGGEPEEHDHGHEPHTYGQRGSVAQLSSISRSSTDGLYGPAITPGFVQGPPGLASMAGRTMTPQQQPYSRQSSFAEPMSAGLPASQAPLFQGQGNSHQASRYFAGADAQSTVNNLKLANARSLGQQPVSAPFHSQPGGAYYPTSSLPGPPPGLKSTATPPSNVFGQGGPFGNSGFGAKDNNEIVQHMIRSRAAGAGQGHDANKLDLADPSILQARIQHHQQSNAGVGSGLFGGQASDDDYGFTPEATSNVDNLVSDDRDEEITTPLQDPLFPLTPFRAPSIPPGLGSNTHGHPPRSATPSRAPPGLLPQQAHPVAPALPVAPVTSISPIKAGAANVTAAEGVKNSKKTSGASTGSDARKNIKALAVESGLSKEITSQSKPTKGKKVIIQEEDFPALESAKLVSRVSTPIPSKAPSIKTPMAIKKPQTETPKSAASPSVPETVTEPASAKSKKAKPMPILNIGAATKVAAAARRSNPSSAVTSAVEKPDDASFPALPTPGASASSPANRMPKTLRMVETPKTEASPVMFPSSTAPPLLRQAYSGLQQRPDTPASSENISDSASIISASVSASRTNSPPPTSRIGSAPVRTVTKSQQKKARKDATKKEAAAIATGPKVEPETEVAPIMGRMKKQKKKEVVQAKPAPAGVESRPVSPGPAAQASDKTNDKASEKAAEKVTEQDSKPTPEEKVSVYRQAVNESISLDGGLVARPKRKDTSMANGEARSNIDTSTLTPATVMQELVKAQLAPTTDALALLKPISSTSHRAEQNLTATKTSLPELKSVVTKEDQEALLTGKPVHKIVEGVSTMLTPNGNFVRGLTTSEEARYLELQRTIAASHDDPALYVHPRHEVTTGYNVIKGRAVANGPPPYFPQAPIAPEDENALPVVQDPMQKMTREEALANINQAILTRFNLGTMNLSSLVDHKHNMHDPHVDDTSSPHQHTAQAAVSKDLLKKLGPLLAANAMQAQDAGGEAFSGLAPTMPPPPVAKVPTAAKTSALAGITSMSLDDMEASWAVARKEAEKLEKSLNQVIKKNRRILLQLSSPGGGSMVH